MQLEYTLYILDSRGIINVQFDVNSRLKQGYAPPIICNLAIKKK